LAAQNLASLVVQLGIAFVAAPGSVNRMVLSWVGVFTGQPFYFLVAGLIFQEILFFFCKFMESPRVYKRCQSYVTLVQVVSLSLATQVMDAG